MERKIIISHLITAISVFIVISLGMPLHTFSQNVGIGISNPTRAKLELNGAAGATSAIFGGESSGISLQRNYPAIGFNQYYSTTSKYMSIGYAANLFLDPNTGYMGLDMLGTGNANTTALIRAFTIADNGNIGIGTNPSNATLFVKKGTNVDGSAVFGGSQYNSHFHYGPNEDTYIRGGKYGSNVIINDIPNSYVILGGGDAMVGINSSNPTYTLEIRQINNKGLVLIDPDFNFNNWEQRVNYYLAPPQSHLRLYYNGTGVGAFYPNGGYTGTVSDMRVKTNVTDLSFALNTVMQLQPVSYEMKDHNEMHEKTFGFIAQEVKAVYPNLVSIKSVITDSVNHINDLHGLNYNGFSIIAIKALQEQMNQIKALETENISLLKRLEELEKMIAAKGY